MMPYGRQSISDEDIEAVVKVLRGDWLTTGPFVAAFEAEIGRLAGGHRAISMTSGTAALHAAYVASGVGQGDEVITTPMTFVATASMASLVGAKVVFADVEEDTALLDPAAVEAAMTDRTKLISAVDYAGHPADYETLQLIADRFGVLTLDDAAHSIGGHYRGRPVGDLADLTTFSFFPTKNMTTGEGGAVIAKDPLLAQKAHDFHFIGLVRDPDRFKIINEGPWHQEVHEIGVNYRLSDIASALGLSQLTKLEKFKLRRQEIFTRYNNTLKDVAGVSIPVQRNDVDPVWHLYPLRVHDNRRREVFEKMRADGIGVQVNYIPVYWHPVYEEMGYKRGMCPNAEKFYQEELSLPLFPSLTDTQVDQVVGSLLKALR